jgi:hypothetical protein
LQRDAGGYFIQTRVRIPVEVEDAPWVITRVEFRDGALRAQVNDGSEEIVDAATIRLGPGHVPYAAVKRGAFEARLGRAAAFQLLALADYDEATERGTLRVGGREISGPRSRMTPARPCEPPGHPQHRPVNVAVAGHDRWRLEVEGASGEIADPAARLPRAGRRRRRPTPRAAAPSTCRGGRSHARGAPLSPCAGRRAGQAKAAYSGGWCRVSRSL